jgi:hypothetical protein
MPATTRVDEPGRQGGRLMRVAGERDGLAAFLAPPGEDPGVQRYPGVDLERLPRVGQRPQHMPVLIL